MGIRFRFTKNRRQDLVRFLGAGVVFFLLITIFWNHGRTPLDAPEAGYEGFILKGTLSGRMLNAEGIAVLRQFIEQNTRPAYDPFTILYHHRRVAAGGAYDLIIGLRPADTSASFREYGIYQDGRTVYLQVEPVGIDRVLKANFSPQELENALSPYTGVEFKTNPASEP